MNKYMVTCLQSGPACSLTWLEQPWVPSSGEQLPGTRRLQGRCLGVIPAEGVHRRTGQFLRIVCPFHNFLSFLNKNITHLVT